METMLQKTIRLHPDDGCEWVLLCMNTAVDFREHSILGMVPVCTLHTDPGPDPYDKDREY